MLYESLTSCLPQDRYHAISLLIIVDEDGLEKEDKGIGHLYQQKNSRNTNIFVTYLEIRNEFIIRPIK